VTLAAGAFTTIVACFPFVFSRLLEFVALYGILLMPIGAIVFVEHYVFPKIGLRRYWLRTSGRSVNWPALVAWFGAVMLACVANYRGWMHLFFIPLPLWFLAATAYTVLAAAAGATSRVHDVVATVAPIHNAVRAQRHEYEHPESIVTIKKPWFLPIVGIVALLALLACLALPFWVVFNESLSYADRLIRYRVWLAWASVTHLAACAVWIMSKSP
jgi:NCS1 family nucleobase:cation symporter-1